MREENRNLLLAIVLSVAVLLGWNYFFAVPQAEKQRQTQQTDPADATVRRQGTQPASPSQARRPRHARAGDCAGCRSRGRNARDCACAVAARRHRHALDQGIDQPARAAASTTSRLKNYRETVDPTSPNIVLFSPSGSPHPYYAEFGWVGGQPGSLPGPDTVWTRRQPSCLPRAARSPSPRTTARD